jgi:hypothetical protein
LPADRSTVLIDSAWLHNLSYYLSGDRPLVGLTDVVDVRKLPRQESYWYVVPSRESCNRALLAEMLSRYRLAGRYTTSDAVILRFVPLQELPSVPLKSIDGRAASSAAVFEKHHERAIEADRAIAAGRVARAVEDLVDTGQSSGPGLANGPESPNRRQNSAQ